MIEPDGNYYCIALGNDIKKGEQLQFVAPALAWFSSGPTPQSGFIITGCTVSPGFDFSDFVIAEKEELAEEFPEQKSLILQLCH